MPKSISPSNITGAPIPFTKAFLSVIFPQYNPFDEEPFIRIPPENRKPPKHGNEELLMIANDGGPIVVNVQFRLYNRQTRTWNSLSMMGYTIEFQRGSNVWKFVDLLRDVMRAFVGGRCKYARDREAHSQAERVRREDVIHDRKVAKTGRVGKTGRVYKRRKGQ